MTKHLIQVLVTISVFSCSPLKIGKAGIVGEYQKHETAKNTLSVNHSLILNSDNTFSLSIKMQDANPECDGKWEIKDNFIYLKCNDTENTIAKALSSGYMKERAYKLEVINKNKIKFKYVTLKRIY